MKSTVKTNLLYGSGPGAEAVVFNRLEGVPFRADTKPPFASIGMHVGRLGPVLPSFAERLTEWVFHLQELSGRCCYAVVTPSVWRAHPDGSERPVSRHTRGQAIDIGGVWWGRDDGVTAWGYSQRRREAIAVEATLRLLFGTVLGPASNEAHADHWHVDSGRAPLVSWSELRQSQLGTRKVEVVYLQEACAHVHGVELVSDGIWGPKTAAAVSRVVSSLRSPSADIRDPEAYLAFNVATALRGFGQLERASNNA